MKEHGDLQHDARFKAFPECFGVYDDYRNHSEFYVETSNGRHDTIADWAWYESQGITPEDIPLIDR